MQRDPTGSGGSSVVLPLTWWPVTCVRAPPTSLTSAVKHFHLEPKVYLSREPAALLSWEKCSCELLDITHHPPSQQTCNVRGIHGSSVTVCESTNQKQTSWHAQHEHLRGASLKSGKTLQNSGHAIPSPYFAFVLGMNCMLVLWWEHHLQ